MTNTWLLPKPLGPRVFQVTQERAEHIHEAHQRMEIAATRRFMRAVDSDRAQVHGDADVRDGVAGEAGAGGEIGAADEDMADAGLVAHQADLLCGDEDI
ncbi:hypothetical protein [Streptomyces sp. NPDC001137]|uniref:hypothetical protein n=1 Tax=Streptomyces sp. NPDC001137 TaxID=3154378 RepID=UPI003325A9DA